MISSKQSNTLILTTDALTLHNGTPLANPAEYRAIVGFLQYLSLIDLMLAMMSIIFLNSCTSLLIIIGLLLNG